jgi:flagellar biosynthesis protein FlhF
MKIKKFKAKTFGEALVLVKREMGSDAVILASEELKGLLPYVEVTAAVDYELGAEQRAGYSFSQYAGATAEPAHARAVAGGRGISGIVPAEGARSASQQDAADITAMRQELGSLKSLLEGMKKTGFEVALPEQKKKVFQYLRKRAIREELALRLSGRETTDMNSLVSAISKDLKIYDYAGGGKVVMLIGPTGVGKTTTIAKLAARAIKNRQTVAMIGLDTYRIGAVEQIRIYAKIMGIPLDVVSDAEGLRKSLTKYGGKDMVFIDTTGRNPRDRKYMDELKPVYKLNIPIDTHLLLSASSDNDFMAEACRHYRNLPIDCLAFTKTDEAVKFGSIYNLSNLYQKPVAYITTGQSVPSDISFPDSKHLAAMILKNEVTQ